ncbi:hypothetical protein SCP_0208130 [Sparassis crispa]|uniref:Uncharacterized protein n=1 Tax=Sparassis crispa TaxID=139825 RepID=A0A401GBW0_9APHY|nr:hypothetical protein SCP_0208130 [Sparassis crispa]GBE79613.1 hypothetical protein SCP_0208130 [Sparassis crispa]
MFTLSQSRPAPIPWRAPTRAAAAPRRSRHFALPDAPLIERSALSSPPPPPPSPLRHTQPQITTPSASGLR